MKPGRAIALYVAAVAVLSCLVAPWVYLALQQWGGELARYPFRRVFGRVVLVFVVLGLWPLLRVLGVGSLREIGFGPLGPGSRQLLWGKLLGLASLALAAQLVLWLGGRSVVAVSWGRLAEQCAGFALTAMVVALIEETVFRGGIQTALQRSLRLGPALVLTSAIYSAVHFLQAKKVQIPVEDVRWWTGFDHLQQVLWHSWQAQDVGRGFITLWLAGMVLGCAVVWSRSLYLSIGLHAGWVFMLKFFAWATQRSSDAQAWWVSANLRDNVVCWPVLLVMWGYLWWRFRPGRS